MIKKILLLFSFSSILIFSQENINNIKSKINEIISDQYFDTAQIAIDVYDLTANEFLFRKNENQLLHPASNMKILTTSSALVFLGPDYKFTTSLYYTGQIINKTLYGDLFVIGGGDPDFNSQDLDSLVKQLNTIGVNEISGNIYGDVSWKDSLFWGNGWMWDDAPSTDEMYLSALNINDNAIGVFVEGEKIGKKAKVTLKPQTNYVNLTNETVTVTNDSGNTFKVKIDWLERKNDITIKGNVRKEFKIDSSRYWTHLTLWKPENYFLSLLKESLKKNNIKFSGETKIDTLPVFGIHLYSFERRFDSVIVNLNKTSDNLSAEMTMYAMAEKFFGKPASAKNGIKMIDSLITLTGLNPKNYRLVDGSGVSHYNLVSAGLLLSVLKYIYFEKPELYKILYNSFPVAGVDGTLENRMENTIAKNNVHAKTGTLSGVAALSGYLTAQNNHKLVFSILIQNFVGSPKTARDYQDRICEILAGY